MGRPRPRRKRDRFGSIQEILGVDVVAIGEFGNRDEYSTVLDEQDIHR
jgi:hypothetical protein